MPNLEEKVEGTILDINALHDAVVRTNWASINREGFVFELESNTGRLKSLYLKLEEINREVKMLLEKNAPSIDTLNTELAREITVLESNLAMEKKKKLRTELVNELETAEVPELYSSLQQKILSLSLKARYNIDKVRNFLIARKTPFVKKGSTAKHLLEALTQKEAELSEEKQKLIELKRKVFLGAEEKSVAEIETELHEMDKKLSEMVSETKKSLKTHLAQINYVEGSFIQLKNRVEEVEGIHSDYTKKTVLLVQELKKERDFAKTLALEVEQETLNKRSEYTKQLLELEEKKSAIEDRMREKYEKEIASLKRQFEEKNAALKHAHKLVEKLENEIKGLKGKTP